MEATSLLQAIEKHGWHGGRTVGISWWPANLKPPKNGKVGTIRNPLIPILKNYNFGKTHRQTSLPARTKNVFPRTAQPVAFKHCSVLLSSTFATSQRPYAKSKLFGIQLRENISVWDCLMSAFICYQGKLISGQTCLKDSCSQTHVLLKVARFIFLLLLLHQASMNWFTLNQVIVLLVAPWSSGGIFSWQGFILHRNKVGIKMVSSLRWRGWSKRSILDRVSSTAATLIHHV